MSIIRSKRFFGISIALITGVVLAGALIVSARQFSSSADSLSAVAAPTNAYALSVVKPDTKMVKLSGKSPYSLGYDQLFSARDVRYGLTLSDYLKALDQQSITFEGYLTPSPIGLDLDFVFLTESPIGFCPCCVSTGDIPKDMMMVMFNGHKPPISIGKVRVTGRFEISTQVDEHTGFVSSFRMYADKFDVVDDQLPSQENPATSGQVPVSGRD